MISAADLVGSWELLSCEIFFSDGRPTLHPYGEAARGRIVYGADGWMAATLSRGDRPPLAAGGLEFSHQASEPARAAAFDSYLAYSGRWQLRDDTVVHTVDMALVPDVVGAKQVRRVTWDGDVLVLGYEVVSRSGVERRYRLRWRRARPATEAPHG